MKRTIAILLSLILILSLCAGCSGNGGPEQETAASSGTEAEPAKSTDAEPVGTETAEPAGTEATEPAGPETPEPGRSSLEGQFSLALPQNEGIGAVEFGSPAAQPATMPSDNQAAASQPNALVQLTMEDIQAMNGDSTVIDIYNNDGYLSTLVGKYYEGKVNNYEDGVDSIKGIASLLGLTKGCEFFIVYAETDDDGYTYYTYQQRYGRNTLQYATLRICVDPQGYTAGLTCSFVPNAGTALSHHPRTTDNLLYIKARRSFRAFCVYNCHECHVYFIYNTL